jgi:hypothetical protein
MKRLSFACGFLATLLLGASVAAQAPPAAAKNLQVLPKEWTTAQVLPVMREIAAALGTECGHCHVWTGAGAPGNDFPADVKPEKAKARVMLKMVMDINTTISTEFTKLGKPANQLVKVECVTCHRGQIIPKRLVDIVADQSNAAAGVAKYRDMRKEFYGSQSYDFTDTTLFDAATRANVAMKYDDAILYAQTNLEFNPKSARTYQVMSQAYQRKGDMPAAIAAMEKAAALDPALQTQLNNLKNPPARGGAPAGGAGGQGRGRGQ